MAATITAEIDSTTTSPVLVLDVEVNRTTSTVIHRIIGATEPWVSLGDQALRSGRLELLYDDDADAIAAETILAKSSHFTLTFPERPSLEMTFAITADGVRRTYRRPRWVIELGYQQVTT